MHSRRTLRWRSRSRQNAPASRVRCVGRSIGHDQRALGFVRGRMRGGLVTKPPQPQRDPHEAHATEDHQDGAPAHVREQRRHQQGSQRGRGVGTREKDSLGSAARPRRYPARHDTRHAGPRAGLAHAEQETRRHQRHVVERAGRGDGEQGPPCNNARQHGLRAVPVGPACGRDLEGGVRENEGEEHPALLAGVETEFLGDARHHDADAGTIQVGDHGERHHEHEHDVTRASGAL